MAELVKQGKVKYSGLSETIKRTNQEHPITALQMEYSLWSRDAEGIVLETCKQLGLGFISYSSLG